MVTSLTEIAKRIIEYGAGEAMTDRRFLEYEIADWKRSDLRNEQLCGDAYYNGYQDIMEKTRKAIGADGKLFVVDNLPNNKVKDNQYGIHVDRKVNYILGKPFLISSDDDNYVEALKTVLDKNFMRKMKTLARHALNEGIAWLYPYYSGTGEFKFKIFPGYECLPFWKDSEHTELDILVRLYSMEVYEGKKKKTVEKVEVYSTSGVENYILQDGGGLVPDIENPGHPYLTHSMANGEEESLNWQRIPLIPFKCNDLEKPLIRDCKELQDAINDITSKFADDMQADSYSTILVVRNYDGQNLAEFRQNLATYGAVKVSEDGGIDSLQVQVNAENYNSILDILKKKLIENARSFDAKDDRIGSNANQMNLQSMYSDIDLDANAMETEFQAALDELLFFIDAYLSHTGQGDFSKSEVNFAFDRDMMMNESEIISGIKNSVGILSTETLVETHPYVADPQVELDRIAAEKKQNEDEYFNKIDQPGGTGGNGDGKE